MARKSKSMGRRDFFKSTTAATAGLLLVKAETAFGTSANSALQLGIIGCGGRGTNVAEAFVQHTNTRVTALCDLFDDRLEAAGKHFDTLQAEKGAAKISKFYKGGRAYQQLVASDVDVVLISSPPYFHPQHLEATLDAKKHVYLEKPVATDVRGCKKVMALAPKADNRVSAGVGFQIRSGRHFVELTRRLHEGAIGEIVLAQGFYFAGDLTRKAQPGMSKAEARIRDWVFDRVLSGDVLVEQNVHIVDIFNWVLKAHPLRALATGARKVRTSVGDVWDHFVVTYFYPNDVRASFMSTQFLPQWATVCARFFGPKGYSEEFYTGGLRIRGENAWEAGADEAAPGTRPEVDPLSDATPAKVKAFVASIQDGKFLNELKQGAESSLSAMLGRNAAYEGVELTWNELLASDQSWDAHLDLDRLS